MLSLFDDVISRDTGLVPDLLIARTEELGPANLQIMPSRFVGPPPTAS